MKNKPEISFYHLMITPVLQAMPKLLEKIISSNQRAVIYFENQEKMKEMNNYLWAFSTKTVIPHGSNEDLYPEEQPIYLTTNKDNPNNASIIIMQVDSVNNQIDEFEKCFFLFDGNNVEDSLRAKQKLEEFTQNQYKVLYWQQNIKGAWENVNKAAQ